VSLMAVVLEKDIVVQLGRSTHKEVPSVPNFEATVVVRPVNNWYPRFHL
jgi:hypothetical protein